MPEPEKTPAPTRRFLPPSSSSTAKATILSSSVRRNPFQSTRSTQPPPSATSSFAGTPRFQRPTPTLQDDIQTSFDDDPASAMLSKTGLIGGKGGIPDLDDDETHQTLSPLYSRGARAAEGVHEHHAESEASPLQHRLRKSAPATKRRKVSHYGASVVEPIAISSSPEDDSPDEASFQIDAGSRASQSDLDDDEGRPTGRPAAAANESSRITRFRPVAQGLSPPSPVSRTVFKTVPEDYPPGSVGSGPVLPDIFSPSRRKGKRDYIPGGSASLVRSWVLDIATRESHAESLSEEMLRIAAIEKDASGRFVIVSDEEGARWLLPEQHGRPGRSSSSNWSDLRPGSHVRIKGKATRWSLDLEPQGLGSLVVAAYWEPISPG
ncbi:uncharacterized protein PV07_07945 [Cladophialophora immunda]|uniref:Uncharacterized protein n=1 Tax=Cladophialophora immunda TaxID=569365 RepID=A0A0D1ZJS9_9EURO|nr:uncharacterized protein PV07_07945 [Cladophialophora immunda]KIW28266.1 hypothetical protein PV07_07945 [Cladophialophora immunda]